MPLPRGQYAVRSVYAANGQSEAPPEIRERFEGRLFALRELEERGVRIAGGQAWLTTQARDWRLELDPALGTND